jgi:hypothetical protein
VQKILASSASTDKLYLCIGQSGSLGRLFRSTGVGNNLEVTTFIDFNAGWTRKNDPLCHSAGLISTSTVKGYSTESLSVEDSKDFEVVGTSKTFKWTQSPKTKFQVGKPNSFSFGLKDITEDFEDHIAFACRALSRNTWYIGRVDEFNDRGFGAANFCSFSNGTHALKSAKFQFLDLNEVLNYD